MSPTYYKSKGRLGNLLDEYSREGISVLAAEPSGLMRSTILIICALLIAGIIWSFFGRVDVIVRATGTVRPESEQYRVQTPIKGELIDIYVAEGMPVAKGDILARVNSPQAIELAGQAVAADVQYVNAQRAYKQFPERKKVLEIQLKAIKSKLEADQLAHDKRVAGTIAQLAEEQSIKLQKARAKLAKSKEARDHAKTVLDSHERLFSSPGGGGISRQQVAEKRKDYNDKLLDYQLALAEIGEFEVTLSKEYAKKNAEIEQKSQELLSTEAQYESLILELSQAEQKIESDLRMTRAKALSSAQISYDDIDENNYLRLRAPMDGIVTQLIYKQVGISIGDKTPILLLAPEDARKVLEIQILEKDRAFLKTGMPVKVKVNAFSYQRYGFLAGELEYIAPVTTRNNQTKKVYYKGRIRLEKDYFMINEVHTPIRYGMGANAEILVRKRRLVDLALDPLRNIAG